MNIDITKLTSCGSDWETNRYMFLQTLKVWKRELRKNRLYPSLDYAKQLQDRFTELLTENIESKGWLDREVRGKLIDDRLIVMDKARHISSQLEKLIQFVQWALYENRQLIEEGNIIENFVYGQINLIPISSMERYRGKGYILVPDNKKALTKIFLYELSINWNIDEPVEYLDLELLRSIPKNISTLSDFELMTEFITHSQQLYEPMVYICETDIDFSFNETILPVVKRKLLDSINSLQPYI